jgi:hypothetical protein
MIICPMVPSPVRQSPVPPHHRHHHHHHTQVLHSILEPGPPLEAPEVAVIGISNWALDAAKMNRAVQLSRHEPSEPELHSTAVTIWSNSFDQPPTELVKRRLQNVASAYLRYYQGQPVRDFHGLRDYYSLVKSLCLSPDLSPQVLLQSVCRNFAGQGRDALVAAHFLHAVLGGAQQGAGAGQHVQHGEVAQQQAEAAVARQARELVARGMMPSVVDLVRANLCDPAARHLLIISDGEAALGLLAHLVRGRAVHHVVGSSFQEDHTDDYKYRWGNSSHRALHMLCMYCLIYLPVLHAMHGGLLHVIMYL